MTSKEASKAVASYLKTHNISHTVGIDKSSAKITMVFDTVDAPDHCVESCIWFYHDGMEARTYYSALGAEVCQKSEHIGELLEVLNFINARVFLRCSDGGRILYKPHMLYTPRIYLTVDGCFDITITTMIPYDFCAVAPIETYDYLTKYCPELLDRLSLPIYSVLTGKVTADRAIAHIKRELLEE